MQKSRRAFWPTSSMDVQAANPGFIRSNFGISWIPEAVFVDPKLKYIIPSSNHHQREWSILHTHYTVRYVLDPLDCLRFILTVTILFQGVGSHSRSLYFESFLLDILLDISIGLSRKLDFSFNRLLRIFSAESDKTRKGTNFHTRHRRPIIWILV